MTISHQPILEQATNGEYRLLGYRCPNSCLNSASYVARCPNCSASMLATSFAGIGTVWSHTTTRIPTGDFSADRSIVYLDLDEGPRLLCSAAVLLVIGARARITGTDMHGAPMVVVA